MSTITADAVNSLTHSTTAHLTYQDAWHAQCIWLSLQLIDVPTRTTEAQWTYRWALCNGGLGSPRSLSTGRSVD